MFRISEAAVHGVMTNLIQKTLIGTVAAWVLISGCSKEQGGGSRFAMPPMPVETDLVSVRAVADRFRSVGTIQAGRAIAVVPEIEGSVVGIPFREGEAIRRGDLILKLNDAELAASVERAEALRDQARSTYDRMENVVEQGAGAPQDLDDAAADLKVAGAELALARARLAKTRIVAPFDGIVGARRVSPGAFVRVGQTVTELVQISSLRVHFSVPERHLGKLKRGSKVRISTTAYPGEEIEGKIDVVEPILDASTRSVRVIAIVPNPEGHFRPGMSANVSAVLSSRESALTIPNEAVFATGDQMFVYAVNPDSTVTRIAVVLGGRYRDVVEVLHGLEPGMRVVCAGHQKLFAGAKVLPIRKASSKLSQQAPGAGPRK